MTTPLYNREERNRALGRDTTLSWSRALTHPPKCNRTRHRVIRGLRGRTLCLWQSSWIRCPYLELDLVTSLALKRHPYYSYSKLFAMVLSRRQQEKWYSVVICSVLIRVGPDLGPNCLQWLSPDDKSRR